MKEFPSGFYWGAATAAYQVEGGIENTDWAKGAREGRVPVCGRACDHYNRYEEDFDLAKELGHNAHRLSVEWARIEPEEGKFNAEAIEHYRKVLEALHARGLTPFVTLWHFTLPLWFSERGGFERDDAPMYFARYCAHVAEKLGHLCCNFTTINEPEVFTSNGWVRGTWPPFKRFTLIKFAKITNSGREHKVVAKGLTPFITHLKVRKHLAASHIAAYEAIKGACLKSDINIVRDVIVFKGNWNPLNKLLAIFMNWFWTHHFQSQLQGKYDSIGLNYYFYKRFGDKKTYKKTDMNWDFRPEGIEDALMLLTRYKKPLFVSEAGIADEDDDQRGEYIAEQIRATHRAIERGADVRGHIYWSLLDNYEWALGFEKRFGLIEVDYGTLLRKIRPSALMYKRICQMNAID